MKIAISIPDDIFEEAEYLSRQQGKSRSRLYADAVAEYVGSYRTELVTEQLNAVYSAESSTLDAALASAQHQVIEQEEW
jgi:metal-responsive CopG/Arc/MetJ family transcriptional regulator